MRLQVGGVNLDAIVAGAKVRHLVIADAVGIGDAGHAGVLVGDQDGRTAHDLLLWIRDRSADGAERGLGRRDGRQQR
jgi:hypothetical protein